MCVDDKTSAVQGSVSCLYCGIIPCQSRELKAGKDSHINELGVLLLQAATQFILCLSKLPLNLKCFSLSRELAGNLVQLSPVWDRSVEHGPFQRCVGVTWAGQSSAVIHVPPWLLGQAGGGTEWLSVDFLPSLSLLPNVLFLILFFKIVSILFQPLNLHARRRQVTCFKASCKI